MNHLMPARGSGPRFFRWLAGALLAASLALAAPVFFDGGPALADASATPQTVQFGCIGFPQLFGVPPGVTQITVHAVGAAGGRGGGYAGGSPGYGASIDATLYVTPGDTLQVTVGCQGSVGDGGYGGYLGGSGGRGFSSDGGGGGGATVIQDVETSTVLLAAAGGGGGGGQGRFSENGGNGGTYVNGGGSGSPGSGSGAGGGGAVGASTFADGTPNPNGASNTQGFGAAGGGGGGGAGYPNGGLDGFNGGDVGGGGGGGAGTSFVANALGFLNAGAASAFTNGGATFSYNGPDGTPQIFACTQQLVRYFVPSWANQLSVIAIGANGGTSSSHSGGEAVYNGRELGGLGASLTGKVRVNPGDELLVNVGCQGQPASQGGSYEGITNPGGAGGYGYEHGGNGGNGQKLPITVPPTGGEGGCGGGGSTGIYYAPFGDQLVAGGGGGCGGSGQNADGLTFNCCGGNGGNASGPGTPGSTGGDGDPTLDFGYPGGSGGGLASDSTDGGAGGNGGQNTYSGNLDGGGGGGGGGVPAVGDISASGGGGGTVPSGQGDADRAAGGGGGGGSFTGGSNVTEAGFFDNGIWRGFGNLDGLIVITPTFSVPQDLTVSATATPTLAHVVTWGISKSVDSTSQSIGPSSTKATFNYTVMVTHEPGPESNWKALGSITVTNPNHYDVGGVTITDATNNGGTCSVLGGTNRTVPGNSSTVVSYLCTYAEAPTPSSGTDTATVSWAAFGSPSTSATGTAAFDFAGIPDNQTSTIDTSVTVTDSLAGTLGTVNMDDPSPTTFTYPLSFSGVAGTCTMDLNTASITTNTTKTTASKEVAVKVCTAAEVSLQPRLNATEGMRFSGAVATFKTNAAVSVATMFKTQINWGDGSGPSSGTISVKPDGSFAINGDHTYADEGSYDLTVTVDDLTKTETGATGTATVSDAPLTTSPVTLNATEGASFSGRVASFTDANPRAPEGDFTANIEWGDGTITSGTIHGFGDGRFDVLGTHTYAEESKGNGYTITVTITDKGGQTAKVNGIANVADALLSAKPLNLNATEGAPFSGPVATFTDADPSGTAGDYVVTVDWGDGTTPSHGTIGDNGDGSFTVSAVHTFAEEGSYPITVSIKDDGGSTANATGTATVADAPLTAKSQNILSGTGTSFNGAVATFTDSNPNAPLGDYSASIDWGDSSAATSGTISANADGSFTVNGSHTYAALGPHTVKVHIMDKGGSTADVSNQILSYAYLGQGSFVLGDQTVTNAAPGATVTWWGAQWDAQWAGNDTLSGGPAPTDFKGFAQSLSSTPPVADGSWTTVPGSSPMPPDSVPSYMAVIVTSHVTESGSTISGNIVHLVIVKTDPGYGPNAGHAGSGTIVATVF